MGERFRQNPGGARRRGEGGSILKPPPRSPAHRPAPPSLQIYGRRSRGGNRTPQETWGSGCDRILEATTTGRLFETPLAGRATWKREGLKELKGRVEGFPDSSTEYHSMTVLVSILHNTSDPTLSRLCWGRNRRHLFEINCSIQSHLCTYLCQGWPSPTAGKRFG